MTGGIVSSAARASGRVLAAATTVVSAARPSAKPLHPKGQVWSAELRRAGGARTGAAWIDEPGQHEALVRRSRAAGLPSRWPDVHGVAVRVVLDEGPADMLLASTGSSALGRFVLRPGRWADSLFYGSLLPYRSPSGPILLAGRTADGETWELLYAQGRGPWTGYGSLTLGPGYTDPPISFDPVLHPLPGLGQYDAITRLRLPAYRTARRGRAAG